MFVGVVNKFFIVFILKWYSDGFDFVKIGFEVFGKVDLIVVVGIWLVELVFVIGIIIMIVYDWKRVIIGF